MMRFRIAAALIAAALVPAAANAQPAAQPYRAHGTEPFWSLTIDARTIRFEAPGKRPVTVAKPRVIVGFAGEIYQTPKINVNIVHRECSDGMSDRSYHDTVQVTVNSRRFSGCGGEAVTAEPQPVALAGNWRIALIDGRPAWGRSPATIRFSGARMSGSDGCNGFSARYRFERGVLDAGPIAATKRFCGDRGSNTQSFEIQELLGQRLTVSSNREGKLVLTTPDGRKSLTLVPERD